VLRRELQVRRWQAVQNHKTISPPR
jgi:hypothetical protein